MKSKLEWPKLNKNFVLREKEDIKRIKTEIHEGRPKNSWVKETDIEARQRRSSIWIKRVPKKRKPKQENTANTKSYILRKLSWKQTTKQHLKLCIEKACTLCFWEFRSRMNNTPRHALLKLKSKATYKGKIRLSDCDSKGMEAICLKHRRKKWGKNFISTKTKVYVQKLQTISNMRQL